jgi:hypothetical protein
MIADRFPAPDLPATDPPATDLPMTDLPAEAPVGTATGSGAPRLRPAVSYYRQRGVIVTNHYFCASGYRYEIAHLSHLMRTRGSLHPGVIVGMVTAVAEAAVIVPLVSVVRALVAWLMTFAALLVPCLVGYVCAHRWPPQYELLATYRGREVTLFTTADEREFGQVSRALQRAVEAKSL